MKLEEADFLAAMIAEFGNHGATTTAAVKLLSLARSYQSNAKYLCNGGMETYYEARKSKLEKRITQVMLPIKGKVKLGGDPRGFTVKVMMPKTKRFNSWGGAEEGWGVPTP